MALEEASVHIFEGVTSRPGGNGYDIIPELLPVVPVAVSCKEGIEGIDVKGETAKGAGVSRISYPVGRPWLTFGMLGD